MDEPLFRMYAYRRSTGQCITKEYRNFVDGATEAGKLKQDPDILYVNLGEVVRDPSGIVTIGPDPVMFIPVEEKFWACPEPPKPQKNKCRTKK